MNEIYYDWSPQCMLEVRLKDPDDFLKIKETLTRIGIASRKTKTLYQSCHILHKQGHYYIVHFKELFALDGKETSLAVSDVERRNAIASLLADWELLTLVDPIPKDQQISLSQIKVISFNEKPDWELVAKYSIGNKRKP